MGLNFWKLFFLKNMKGNFKMECPLKLSNWNVSLTKMSKGSTWFFQKKLQGSFHSESTKLTQLCKTFWCILASISGQKKKIKSCKFWLNFTNKQTLRTKDAWKHWTFSGHRDQKCPRRVSSTITKIAYRKPKSVKNTN